MYILLFFFFYSRAKQQDNKERPATCCSYKVNGEVVTEQEYVWYSDGTVYGTVTVAHASRKVHEARWRCFGHGMRRDEGRCEGQVREMEV